MEPTDAFKSCEICGPHAAMGAWIACKSVYFQARKGLYTLSSPS